MEIVLTILAVASLEVYLRGVLPAEMIPTWPAEALKVGAICARSYAAWRYLHPRSESFALYGDDRDQVWRPDLMTPATDRAVAATTGLVVTREGQVVCTQYVAKCGRPDCPLCQGQNGYDGKTWAGRLCQYGARKMAEEGMSAIEILRHYYGEHVVLLDVENLLGG